MASSRPQDSKQSPDAGVYSGRSASAAGSQGQDAPDGTAQSAQAELAKAFQELARGEQHAAALEANLSSLESKLDALLAAVGEGPGGVDLNDFDVPEVKDDEGGKAKGEGSKKENKEVKREDEASAEKN